MKRLTASFRRSPPSNPGLDVLPPSPSLPSPLPSLPPPLPEPVFVIAKRTKAEHYLTKSGGFSKNEEYLRIEGSPCLIIKTDDTAATLLSLHSTKTFQISKQVLHDEFTEGILDEKGFMINLDPQKYPANVNINEFDERKKCRQFNGDVNEWIKTIANERLKNLFVVKFSQLLPSAGNTKCENIKTIKKSIQEKKAIPPNGLKTHKRFGSPIFNRQSRWSPVADHVSFDEFEKCGSYPWPLGIRKKDFCLPSTWLTCAVEMIKQILSFDNVDETYRIHMQKIFTEYGFDNIFDGKIHLCKYCGNPVDLNLYSLQPTYKSATNFIEICHRDPNSHFSKKNMYWGHGECNRRQGGYTERERIEDAIVLITNNPNEYHNERERMQKALNRDQAARNPPHPVE